METQTITLSNTKHRKLTAAKPVMLALCLLLASPLMDAQVYKYRKPNGKLLFTDAEIFDDGYVLLNAHEIKSQPILHTAATRNVPTTPTPFDHYIYRASELHGVEVSLIKAIIKAESDFDPDAKSRAGAEGLMQLMPKTARSYNVHNSYNSEQNIMAGTKHIRYLLNRYKNDLVLALAAYNAGETAVNRHNGVPPFPETQRYVQKVQTFKKQFEMHH